MYYLIHYVEDNTIIEREATETELELMKNGMNPRQYCLIIKVQKGKYDAVERFKAIKENFDKILEKRNITNILKD